jgi:hypothetical protein
MFFRPFQELIRRSLVFGIKNYHSGFLDLSAFDFREPTPNSEAV